MSQLAPPKRTSPPLLLVCARSTYGDGSIDFVGGSSLPAVNSDKMLGSQAAVLGTILFNFGFVTTVPSWINEKEPSVRSAPAPQMDWGVSPTESLLYLLQTRRRPCDTSCPVFRTRR